MADATWIKAQRERLFNLFSDYHTAQKEWRARIQRKQPEMVPDDLVPFWTDLQSPMLEDTISQSIGLLTLDQTKIDFQPIGIGSDKPHYQKDVESARLRAAVSQRKQNEGRWRDEFIAECQAGDHGVAVVRKMWDIPEEPEGEEERERFYADPNRPWEFHEEGIDTAQCAWDGKDMEDPDIFIWEAEMRYYEAKTEWQAGKRKQWRLNDLGDHVILGQAVTTDEVNDGKRVKFLVCDYLDPESKKRYICEYIYPADQIENGEVVFEDENPLGCCSFFVIPSGELRRRETNPHLRYRPLHYPLIVTVGKFNWLTTLIASLAVRALDRRSVYLDTSKMTPEARAMMEEFNGRIEGMGASRPFVFEPPDLPAGAIQVFGGQLASWPNNISDALGFLLTEVKEELQTYGISPALVGNVPDTVQANAPASSLRLSLQSAQMPYGRALVKSDDFIRRDIEAEHRAYIFWDEAKMPDAQRTWSAVAGAPIKFIGGNMGSGGEAKATDVAKVTADMLKTRNFIVNVQTSNRTQAEIELDNREAQFEFEHGIIDNIQRLRRFGHEDPHAQQKVLAVWEATQLFAMKYAAFEAANVEAYFAATAQLDPGAVANMGQQGAGASPSAPSPPPSAPTNGNTPPPGGNTPSIAYQGARGGNNPGAGVGM